MYLSWLIVCYYLVVSIIWILVWSYLYIFYLYFNPLAWNPRFVYAPKPKTKPTPTQQQCTSKPTTCNTISKEPRSTAQYTLMPRTTTTTEMLAFHKVFKEERECKKGERGAETGSGWWRIKKMKTICMFLKWSCNYTWHYSKL